MPEAPEKPTRKASEILLERIEKLRADHVAYESLAPLEGATDEARQKLEEQKEIYKKINLDIPLYAEPTEPLSDEVLAPHVTFAPPGAAAPDPSAQTETLINGMIAELHMLMRAIAMPTAARSVDFGSRRAFLTSAMDLAKTGGELGRVVAKIRKSETVQYRERHTHEREVTRENG